MSRVKDIIVKPIQSKIARDFVCRHHYSGKTCNNSSLHLGCFLDGLLGGVMQFGPSLFKKNMLGLVRGTEWNGFLELNRMAFSDLLPRNSESRCLGVALRLIRRNYPHIKWIVSFADGAQCGDGTIYRASGFLLTQINPLGKRTLFFRLPRGESYCSITSKMCGYQGDITKYCTRAEYDGIMGAKHSDPDRMRRLMARIGGVEIPGFSLRYIYFTDPSWRERLAVPILPFSAIAEAGARMYKGRRIDGEGIGE